MQGIDRIQLLVRRGHIAARLLDEEHTRYEVVRRGPGIFGDAPGNFPSCHMGKFVARAHEIEVGGPTIP